VSVSFLRRLAHTPLRDVVRLRVTGRMDRAAVLARSGLGPQMQGLIARIAKRTRLRRLEKADVTRELVSHFIEAIDAGATGEEAIERFGDPKLAARLIRRAKLRQRGVIPMVIRRGTKGALVALLLMTCVYAYLSVRFFTGSPRVTRDHLAEINAPAAALPEEDRAWPLYREAKLRLTGMPDALADTGGLDAASIDDRALVGAARAFVEENEEALELIHHGSEKAGMGAVLSHEVDAALHPDRAGSGIEDAVIRESLIGVLLPQLGVLRGHARLLATDALLASLEDDADRALSDLEAMARLGVHCDDLPMLISELTAMAILAYALQTAGDLLEIDPDLFSDEQLARLGHVLAGAASDEVTAINWQVERRIFDDIVQRVYTDDGTGDGRLVFEGLKGLATYSSLAGTPIDLGAGALVAGPVAGAIAPGRAELTRAADELYGHAERVSATPLWRWDADVLAPPIDLDSPLERIWLQTLRAVAPAYRASAFAREQLLQRRDAVLGAIALELHRRRHDAYPEALDALGPDLLPSLPRDRFDGGTLRYVLTESGPLLYSVGPDGVDDGGRPMERRMSYDVWAAFHGLKGQVVTPAHRGDWVLWPRLD